MGKLAQQVRERGRRLVRRAAPTVLDSVEQVPDLHAHVGDLERRVAELQGQVGRHQARIRALEEEAAEARLAQLRLAELADVVQELLLPAADRDEDRLAELRQRYSATL